MSFQTGRKYRMLENATACYLTGLSRLLALKGCISAQAVCWSEGRPFVVVECCRIRMESCSQRSQAVCPSVKRVNLLPQPGVPLCKWGSLLPFHLWRLWPFNGMQAVLSAFKAVGVQSSPRYREESCHLHLEIHLVDGRPFCLCLWCLLLHQ